MALGRDGRGDLRDVVANLVEADLILQRLLELPAHLLKLPDRGLERPQGLAELFRDVGESFGSKHEERDDADDERFGSAHAEEARVGLRWSVGWVRWTVRIAEVAGSSPGRGAGARGLG